MQERQEERHEPEGRPRTQARTAPPPSSRSTGRCPTPRATRRSRNPIARIRWSTTAPSRSPTNGIRTGRTPERLNPQPRAAGGGMARGSAHLRRGLRLRIGRPSARAPIPLVQPPRAGRPHLTWRSAVARDLLPQPRDGSGLAVVRPDPPWCGGVGATPGEGRRPATRSQPRRPPVLESLSIAPRPAVGDATLPFGD